MPELNLTATCDCGAVTIALSGRPVSMFQCSCQNCQKATGSGHSSIVLMPVKAVSVTGETKSYVRPADSGATFTRHFCPHCATTVYAQSSRAPDFRIVPAGLLAGQNEWYAPNQLIFARSQTGWDRTDENIPHHQTYRVEKPA